MGAIVTNNAVSSLDSSIIAGATSLTLTAGTGALFPSPSGGEYFYLKIGSNSSNEVVKVTARSTDTLTCVATASGWSSGTAVSVTMCKEVYDEMALLAGRSGGQTIYGGTASANDLTLASTSHATKGIVKIATDGGKVQIRAGQAAQSSNKWGMSTAAVGGGTRLEIVDADADYTADQAQVWIEAKHDGNWPGSGDPSVPVCVYAQHEQTGSNTAFTHTIMALAVNSGTGDNDTVAVSGRARKTGAGVGDAAGVWGSAYNSVNQNGGVMGLEGHIYQNVSGMVAADTLGSKWSAACHIHSASTGSDALAGIAIDGSNTYRMWNAILIDSGAFRSGAPTGTVGINMASANPDIGIKFGSANTHISGSGIIYIAPANSVQIKKTSTNAGLGVDSGTGNSAFIDLKESGTVKGNLAVNSGTNPNVLEINSATSSAIELGGGGGQTRVMSGLKVTGNWGLNGTTPSATQTGYSVTNVVTDRSYDANSTSIDEVADVLGTLINDLITKGVISA